MSRPRLKEDKKLSERFIFRLSKDELRRINKAAETCGKAPGPLVREKLFKGKFLNLREQVSIYIHTRNSSELVITLTN